MLQKREILGVRMLVRLAGRQLRYKDAARSGSDKADEVIKDRVRNRTAKKRLNSHGKEERPNVLMLHETWMSSRIATFLHRAFPLRSTNLERENL